MPTFTLKLKNSSSQSWFFGIYQKYPHSVLDNIVWKVKGVPPQGTNQISWSEDYGVSIVQLDDSGIIGSQNQTGALENKYAVITKGGVPSINPTPIGSSGGKDIICLENNTKPAVAVNTGFVLSGNIIAVQKHVDGGITSEFKVHPTYFVDLYTEVKVNS